MTRSSSSTDRERSHSIWSTGFRSEGKIKTRPSVKSLGTGTVVGAWLARVSLLLGFLVFGFAQATPGVTAMFINGHLTGPQLIAGAGFQPIAFINGSNHKVGFNLARVNGGGSQALNTVLSGLDVGAHSKAEMLADLRPGLYLITVDGGKDMNRPVRMSFMVTGSGEPAAMPKASKAVDFLDLTLGLPTTLGAGTSIWKVSNSSDSPRTAVFYKLLPGKSASDLMAFLADTTKSVAKPHGSTVLLKSLAQGQTVFLPLKFSAGNWVAISSAVSSTSGQTR